MTRPMPVLKKTSDTVRLNRVNMRDCPALVHNMMQIKVSRRTVLNWMKIGRKAYSGVVVKLGHEKVLNKYYTTKADLRTFFQEVNK